MEGYLGTMKIELGYLHRVLSSYPAPLWATAIAGFFVLLSLSLSMYLIFEHLSAYKNPEVLIFPIARVLLLCFCSSSDIDVFCCNFAGAEVSSWCHIDGPLLCN